MTNIELLKRTIQSYDHPIPPDQIIIDVFEHHEYLEVEISYDLTDVVVHLQEVMDRNSQIMKDIKELPFKTRVHTQFYGLLTSE